jgi:hypothetical protein
MCVFWLCGLYGSIAMCTASCVETILVPLKTWLFALMPTSKHRLNLLLLLLPPCRHC